MKQFLFFAAVSALVVCSCGTAKRTSNNSSYNSQLQNSQSQTAHPSVAQNQSAQVTPTRKARAVEPCIALSEERDFSAYGTATSYNEKVAINEAKREARYELGQMMKVAVEGAAEDYTKNVSMNKSSMAETLSETINNEFYSECVKNSKVIKTSIYDLSDGTIQVYVCMEVVAGFNVLDKAAEIAGNVLSRDDSIAVEFDKEQFKSKIREGLNQYKENRNK